MKKIIAFFFVCFLAVAVQAEEEAVDESGWGKFALGAGFTYVGNHELHNSYGGHLEFGIILYRKVLFVQNNFVLRAGSLLVDSTDFSTFTVSEKIVIGRNLFDGYLPFYIYLEGGAGIYGNESKGFFDDPPIYTFGFGGGFSIEGSDVGGFYCDLGYLGQKLKQNTLLGGVIVQAGYRFWF